MSSQSLVKTWCTNVSRGWCLTVCQNISWFIDQQNFRACLSALSCTQFSNESRLSLIFDQQWNKKTTFQFFFDNLLVYITVLELRIAYEIWLGPLNIPLTVTFHLVLLDKFLWSANRGDHKLSRPESKHVNKFCSKLILNLWKKILDALAHIHFYKGLF